MAVLVHSLVGAEERAFQCERVYQTEISPHNYPAALLLLLLDVEVAVIKTEVFAVLAVQTTKILKT